MVLFLVLASLCSVSFDFSLQISELVTYSSCTQSLCPLAHTKFLGINIHIALSIQGFAAPFVALTSSDWTKLGLRCQIQHPGTIPSKNTKPYRYLSLPKMVLAQLPGAHPDVL